MQPTETTPSYNSSPQPPVKGKWLTSKKLWLLVIVGLVVAVGIAAYIMFTANNPPADEEGEDVAISDTVADVSISATGIVPATIKVAKGQPVTWTNETAVPHKLFADQEDLPGFDSVEPLEQGDSFTYIFETAGTFNYYDPDDPSAYVGTVTVE